MVFSLPACVRCHDLTPQNSSLLLRVKSDTRLGRTRKSLFLDGHELIENGFATILSAFAEYHGHARGRMLKNKLIATARCHPTEKADNHGVAEGEDGYFNGTTGLPVGIHYQNHKNNGIDLTR